MERVPQEAPEGDGEFTYVEIGAIDREAKRIIDPKNLPIETAPSRARQKIAAGDVLVSMTRPNLNAVALVPPNLDGVTATTGFDVLRAIEIDPRWLYYLVQSPGFVGDMSALVQGVVYPAVRPADIRSYQIPLAPLPEQRRIADALEAHTSRLDAAVSALHRTLTNLKRYRASVLKAACEGRLVPTEAELARQEGRDYEHAEALLQRILAERRARWETEQLKKLKAKGKTPKDDRWKGKYNEPEAPDVSKLPDLPDGWVWASVDQISAAVDYGTSSKTSTEDLGTPVLRMGNILDGRLVCDDLRYLPPDHEEFPRLLLDEGDVLFNRTNSAELVGKTAVYEGNPNPCSFASYLLRIRPLPGVHPKYLSGFINSPLGRAWAASVISQQVGQANINGTKLKNMPFPLPPASEQNRIVDEMERLLSTAVAAENDIMKEQRRADRLRQSILNVSFEGRLVPQDPNDEPASLLLDRIRREVEKELSERSDELELPLNPGGD